VLRKQIQFLKHVLFRILDDGQVWKPGSTKWRNLIDNVVNWTVIKEEVLGNLMTLVLFL